MMKDKDYIAVVQCHLVKQRCSGYICEKAFHERTGGFSGYSPYKDYRTLYLTCGGCCGRPLHRKLSNLVKKIKAKEGVEKDRIVVQLSSCITKDNYHGPACPHLDYLKQLIGKLGLDLCEDTTISKKAERLRTEGTYTTKADLIRLRRVRSPGLQSSDVHNCRPAAPSGRLPSSKHWNRLAGF